MSDLTRDFPVVFSPGVNNVEQSFGKDDNELKRIYTILTSLRGMYKSGTPPTSPNSGDKWHDSTNNVIKEWNGSAWIPCPAIAALTGATFTGVVNEALGTPIASASTINLTTATGNFLHITGTTTITAVTLGAGMRREVIFDGILTLTHHVTNNNLPSSANIITAVGDRATYISDGTTVYCTKYQRADGKAIVIGSATSGGEILQLRIFNNATTPNTKMDITANNIPLYDTSYNQKKSGVISLTADLGVSGANGLDTGTKANSTNYYLWVIGKEDGTIASLWSLSATTPTMPTGYVYKRLVGWNRTDSSGNIYRILQVGNKAQYVVTSATNTANMRQMATGVAGNIATPTFVSVSTLTFIPINATKITLVGNVTGSGNAIIVAPNASYGLYSGITNPPPFEVTGANPEVRQVELFIESTNVYWISSAVNQSIWCMGWEVDL